MTHNHKKPNHLQGQTSPYLKQHLYNPVDWHPWGEDALEKARREDKPVLVSIGYSACHWCHVMEKESFEDESVARIMNENFVCIKVDREERPDIDHLYMNAVQLITGQGGWPLNCFALPDGRPFWGGTYFPKTQWKGILKKIADIYRDHREDLLEQADNLAKEIVNNNFIKASDSEPSLDSSDNERIFKNLMEQMDPEEGGIAGEPKFPMPNNFEFLLHYHYHAGDLSALEQTNLTLHKMARGGIYDHIGGGFARYSTDSIWKAPHFEKMLYDNAQLVSLYSNAWKVGPDPIFKDVVYETVEWVEREMTSPEGLFYSALDADSEGIEGKFYTWTAKEFEHLLGEHAHIIKDHFGVDGRGRWEDEQHILTRPEDEMKIAHKHKLTEKQLANLVDWARKVLFHEREKRLRPGLDDKVLVSWNGLMIKGLTDAYSTFGERRFLDLAKRAADYIVATSMDKDGRLTHTFRNGEPAIDGFLEDYALLIDGLISLYQTTLEESYISKAALLAERAVDLFDYPGANLLRFSAEEGNDKLIVPHFEYIDNVIPSSNSVMAQCLFYLANYLERSDWDERSARMLADIRPHIESHPSHFSNWAILLLHRTEKFYTTSICGKGALKLAVELNSHYLPNKILAGSESPTENPPILRGRFDSTSAKIHACTGSACLPPVDTVEEAIEQMK